jgi:Domain of unknown function (DUF4185)
MSNTRRVLSVRGAEFGMLMLTLSAWVSAFGSEPITGVSFGPPSAIKGTVGDIWTPTWAADGAIYSVQDDAMLPDGSTANLAVNRLDGDDPRNLSYTLVNRMREYGKGNQPFGVEGGTWKGAGIISVDNTLYLSINRVLFSTMDKTTKRIEAIDASIIKSKDGGRTWRKTAEENLKNPMFPGDRFSNPVFIQYGKDVSAKAHGSDRYIYAVSSNGPWSHADYLILGRVLRSKIGDLNGSDWEFYQGGARDSTHDGEWASDAKRATPILRDSENLGWTNIMYVPEAKRYLMAQWHWEKGKWHNGDCTWVLREAPAPWGPWAPVATTIWDKDHDYYFPVFVPKFISKDGRRLYIFTAGQGRAASHGLTVMPIDLQTR